ncbi:YdcH family protein [Kaistia dalseonensis]|uniref:Uncharacterized protein YdcH (DUF465 family) n=2 Tax=Kaistia dalseonensis TaxID=410840 RepID=A0ABU0H499_9HYPH|nr:YdcH family protein [Kaistia dalseonensis]MDQ0436693.1 uncharacterized protein YdcH (DUF465 family) [Kaistia dalseonensis]
MAHTPHELSEEFPGEQEKIAKLSADSAHFAKLADEYHEVNRAIHRAETDVEPTDDLHMIDLRKRRMILKDEIAALLRA